MISALTAAATHVRAEEFSDIRTYNAPDVVRHIMGFGGTRQEALDSPMAGLLSGGERNRLLLARLFTQPANLLVMDEPTNDLDMETLDLLESLLVEFNGTLLLVSHDRAFLNDVVTSTLVFEGDGRVEEYVGGYDDWLRQRRPASAVPAAGAAARPAVRPEKAPAKAKLGYKEQRELEALPQRIEALEREREQLHDAMGSPEFYRLEKEAIADTQSRLAALEEELATAYERWEMLESLRD